MHTHTGNPRLKALALATAGIALSVASLGAQAAVTVNFKYALQGATYGTGSFPLTTDLSTWDNGNGTFGLIPLTDPYGVGVTAAAVPTNAVDWVKIELLAGPAPASCSPVQTTAGFLLRDGSIVGANGGPLTFASAAPGSYNIRIRHRNHAALISTAQTLAAVAGPAVDFTVAGNLVNAGNALARPLGLTARLGDVNQDGVINGPSGTAGTDKAILQAAIPQNYSGVYADLATDVNLDGVVDGNDLTLMTVLSDNLPVPFTFPLNGAVCGLGATPAAVPTLSPGMLGGLSALLAFAAAGLGGLRRRKG